MPLTNDVIMRLNEITSMIHDKSRLDDGQIAGIKSVFAGMLRDGHDYNIEEIGSWFEHEGSWNDRGVRARVTNMAHYVRERHRQGDKLRMADGCGC